MSAAPPTAVVFAYHNIGVCCIKVLLARGVRIPLVVTHQDNHEENIWFESVAALCQEHQIPFVAPSDPRTPELFASLQTIRPDFIFSFYYRHMLPTDLLALAKKGAFNMHGSLLPKYRGRVPVNWAVLHGEAETGVTLHEMVAKPDAGAIVAQSSVPILPDDTAYEVFGKLSTAAEQTLWNVLPLMIEGNIPKRQNDISRGSYFRGRKPEDGQIDWSQPASTVYNLHRAVAPPYPGAWTVVNGRKFTLGKARLSQQLRPELAAGLTVLENRILGIGGDGGVLLIHELLEDGQPVSPQALASVLNSARDAPVDHIGGRNANSRDEKRILIFGINGFVGHHLLRRIMETTNWVVHGMDIEDHRIVDLLNNETYRQRLFFTKGDIREENPWTEAHIKISDVVLPLAGIAVPSSYIERPLAVFDLDFVANLHIVQIAAKYGKRLVFPSTSEVYGMCHDDEFDTEESELICGPIQKSRWIYSCSKQLLDRVIWAYGEEGLDFTIFRPFNWVGSGLDSVDNTKPGGSRVTTQFLGNILRGENIVLVDGGAQRRTFTHIDDGIDALMKIIANKEKLATGKIYNIGNPANNCSIRELATTMLDLAANSQKLSKFHTKVDQVQIVESKSATYYGKGYQDVQNRVPKITNTCADLDWNPSISMVEAIQRLFDNSVLRGV